MKLLGIILVFYQISAIAQSKEIFSPEDSKAIVSQIKDLEIGKKISQSQEISNCSDKHKFDKDQKNKVQNLQAAKDCFALVLKNKTDEQLQNLASELKLQEFGLIPSKSIQEVKNYLMDKLTESLTGVHPKKLKEAKTRKELQELWKKKKLVDQSVYVNLYKTQVGKNALFEVSRFCFENLRALNPTSSPSNFAEYWNQNASKLNNVNDLTDEGQPQFGASLDDGKSKTEDIYQNIFESLESSSQKLNEQFLGTFFVDCGKTIKPLCDVYTQSMNVNNPSSPTKNRGAAACLTQKKLLEYKNILSSSDKIIKQLEQDESEIPKFLLAEEGEGTEFFNETEKGKSLDDLTSLGSSQVLASPQDQELLSIHQGCQKDPTKPDCEKFYTDDEQMEKIKHQIELKMTLRTEVEMARVKTLKDQSLKEYLEANGLFHLIKDDLYKSKTDVQLADEIGKVYEAQKNATLNTITSRLKKRQLKKSDLNDQSKLKNAIQAGADDALNEKARMAQVILFNNIISSHLKLIDSKTNKEIGKNTNAWRKEEQGLKEKKINENLFQHLKATDSGGTNLPSSNIGKISGFEIINDFLGEEKKTSP